MRILNRLLGGSAVLAIFFAPDGQVISVLNVGDIGLAAASHDLSEAVAQTTVTWG